MPTWSALPTRWHTWSTCRTGASHHGVRQVPGMVRLVVAVMIAHSGRGHRPIVEDLVEFVVPWARDGVAAEEPTLLLLGVDVAETVLREVGPSRYSRMGEHSRLWFALGGAGALGDPAHRTAYLRLMRALVAVEVSNAVVKRAHHAMGSICVPKKSFTPSTSAVTAPN